MRNKIKRFIHVTFRHSLLKFFVLYLNKVYSMNIHETARISFKAKLDKTNPRGVNIGAGSYLAFGSVILTHDMSRNVTSSVHIGKNCFIGANAIILPGVELGDSVVVGAGSVVTKSFGSNLIISGNPARIIKENVSTRELGIICDS